MTTPLQLEVTSQQVTDISSPVETLMTEKVERKTTPETPAGSTEGPAPTTNAAEVTLIPPEDNEIKIPSSTTQEMTTEPMNKPTKIGQNVPVEVPLQLQLIVAPEADRIAILPSALASTNREGYDYDASNRRRPSWRSPSFNQDPSNDDDSLDCSSKSTLVAVSVVAVILQAATLVAFYVFYRTKQSSWTKCSDSRKITNTEPVYGIRHSGSVSDVVSNNLLP
jgi:hypothetical protein